MPPATDTPEEGAHGKDVAATTPAQTPLRRSPRQQNAAKGKAVSFSPLSATTDDGDKTGTPSSTPTSKSRQGAHPNPKSPTRSPSQVTESGKKKVEREKRAKYMRGWRAKQGSGKQGRGRGKPTSSTSPPKLQAKGKQTSKETNGKQTTAKKEKKERTVPYAASEYARLFHTIFDDTDEAKETLDLLLTRMSRIQLDANDKRLKNPWIVIEERFNDIDNEWENLFPDHEHCGADIIDPSQPLLVGANSRDWLQLKDGLWKKVRGEISAMLVNYNRSGANDPQDMSDVWHLIRVCLHLIYANMLKLHSELIY